MKNLLRSFLGCCIIVLIAYHTSAQGQQNMPGSILKLLQKDKQDTLRVRHLLELSRYYIFKPGANRSDLDSAMQAAAEAEKLSGALNFVTGSGLSNLSIAQVHRESGQREMAKDIAAKAVVMLEQGNDIEELGNAYMELQSYYGNTGSEMEERLRIVRSALHCYKASGNKLKEADTYQYLGDLLQLSGNYVTSLTELKRALRIYQSIHYAYLQSVYDLLGMVYTVNGDYKEGLKYGLLAVRNGEDNKDSSQQMCTSYNRVGLTYYYLNDFAAAMQYFRKAMVVAQRLNDKASIRDLTVNQVNASLKLNRPKEALVFLNTMVRQYPPADDASRIITLSNYLLIYEVLKEYVVGQTYCDQLIALVHSRDMRWEDRRICYSAIIRFSFAAKQYANSRRFLESYYKGSKGTGNLTELSVIHRMWFKLDSAQGNYLAAIKHLQQYHQITDSLINEAKNKQLAQLEVQYETEKKDQDLKLQGENIDLLTKQGLLQDSQLQQARLLRNVTLGGVLLLLVLIGLLYNRYQFKQRNNTKLVTQQEEISRKNKILEKLLEEKEALLDEKEWLLKEIHHRVKNNLQIVMSLLNTQSVYLQDPAALDAIRDSQNRIHSMSLIHQKLYQSGNVAGINMEVYIQELVQYLKDALAIGNHIRFDVQVEQIELDVSHAVPVGLILNEAITNAIKYAFPGNKEGVITISMSITLDDHYLLTIEDNGAGLPDDFDVNRSGSLGMSLMQGLSGDLDGEFSIENDNGTSIHIVFAPIATERETLTTSHLTT